jgi:hypothetical protein
MPVSMAGLDLSFMKTKESKAALRKMKQEGARQKRLRRLQPFKRSDLASPTVMADITPFVSPVTKEVISSRTTLARHNRTNGVRQCGEIDGKAWTDHLTAEHKKRNQPIKGVSFEWSKPH